MPIPLLGTGIAGTIAKGIGSSLVGSLPILGDLFGQRSQQNFQERMANTSWQRGVADMRKAGINPMLAYMKGGADSPSGASGNTLGGSIEKGISSVMAMRRQREEIANMEATRKNTEAATRNLNLDAQHKATGLPKKQLDDLVYKYGLDFANEANRIAQEEGLPAALAFILAGKLGGKKLGSKMNRRGRNKQRKKRASQKAPDKYPINRKSRRRKIPPRGREYVNTKTGEIINRKK